MGSFQLDTLGKLAITNVRLQWEYLPLSFLDLVLRGRRALDSSAAPSLSISLKLTWLLST